MTPTFYSSTGNAETRGERPEGYPTEKERAAQQPPGLTEIRASKIWQIITELDELDKKAARPAQAITWALTNNVLPNLEDKTRLEELQERKTALRDALEQISKAETVEDIQAVVT